MEPLAVSIKQAGEALNIGNTKIYELINEGHLKTKRIGRRQVVLTSSIKAYLEVGDEQAA